MTPDNDKGDERGDGGEEGKRQQNERERERDRNNKMISQGKHKEPKHCRTDFTHSFS